MAEGEIFPSAEEGASFSAFGMRSGEFGGGGALMNISIE